MSNSLFRVNIVQCKVKYFNKFSCFGLCVNVNILGQFSDDDDIDFNVSLFQKPRTRGSTHHPSRMSKSFSAHHQTPDSLSMKLRLERLMEKHLASPGMKARAEINRINREIDEEQLGRRRLRF